MTGLDPVLPSARHLNPGPSPVVLNTMAQRYLVEPGPGILEEIKRKGESVESLVKEATKYLDDPDVEDMALARMFIERGYSDEAAYWLVREAETEHAPGDMPLTLDTDR